MQPLPKEQIFLKNLRKKEIFGLNVLYIYLYRLDYYRLFNKAQGSPFGFWQQFSRI